MDKYIIDTLIKFGLITNIGIDSSKYNDIDDLINKGIITIPGAKETINKLIGDYTTPMQEIIETTINDEIKPSDEIKLEDNKTIEPIVETAPEVTETPIISDLESNTADDSNIDIETTNSTNETEQPELQTKKKSKKTQNNENN
jgi:hypothetical protein